MNEKIKNFFKSIFGYIVISIITAIITGITITIIIILPGNSKYKSDISKLESTINDNKITISKLKSENNAAIELIGKLKNSIGSSSDINGKITIELNGIAIENQDIGKSIDNALEFVREGQKRLKQGNVKK